MNFFIPDLLSLPPMQAHSNDYHPSGRGQVRDPRERRTHNTDLSIRSSVYPFGPRVSIHSGVLPACGANGEKHNRCCNGCPRFHATPADAAASITFYVKVVARSGHGTLFCALIVLGIWFLRRATSRGNERGERRARAPPELPRPMARRCSRHVHKRAR